MLKTLIEILKDAAEGSLSKFVRRQEFSEEVVSMWLLQKSFKGERALIKMCTCCLHSPGCHLKECQIWQYLSSSYYKTSEFGCNDIFLATENTLWNSRKTFVLLLFSHHLAPHPNFPHRLFSWILLPFSLYFLLKPPVPSPHSPTPASCFLEEMEAIHRECCCRDNLFPSCWACGDHPHLSRAGSPIEPWSPSLLPTAGHQFKRCLTLFWASLISPPLWIFLISEQSVTVFLILKKKGLGDLGCSVS